MRSLLLSALLLFSSHLVRAQQIVPSKDNLYLYEGTFEFGANHRITLGYFDEFNSLVYLDLKTRKVGALVPIRDDVFRNNNDSTMRFIFTKDKKNKLSGLTINHDSLPLIGKRVSPHTRQMISFRSGNQTLKGDLYLPSSKGPHPAVVFAHGSGGSTRGVGFFTTFFLQLGIAVLSFDKQGAGESTGDWQTASFEELANDVIAGIEFLKAEQSINIKKIGVMGNSQGGWIGAMVTAKCKDVSFLIVRVGAGENVMETMIHENRGIYLADGFNENEVDEIVTSDRGFMNSAVNGKTWEQGDSVIMSYSHNSWFKKVYPKPRLKSAQSEKNWTWLSRNLQYDSVDYLQKIKVPLLWLMAEKDWNVNSQRSYPRIINALETGGNKDYLVKIIPHSGHRGLIAKTGYYNEDISWLYAPGYWDTMQNWLKERKFAK